MNDMVPAMPMAIKNNAIGNVPPPAPAPGPPPPPPIAPIMAN